MIDDGLTFDPTAYPLARSVPERLTAMGFWQRHIPFAFALIEMARPRRFVELGTHLGDSYCAFCQAISALGLETIAAAVDSWAGDQHTGAYDSAIYEELRAYHDPRYGHFSTLVRSTFDDALDQFADGSIDLLHIDGTHTYEAVKHDFETWLPKVSERGVVLLHDIAEYHEEFGVWRLWDELAACYPHFAFPFGHGLGVIAVGASVPEGLRPFFADRSHAGVTISYFAELGRRVVELGQRRAQQEPDEVTATPATFRDSSIARAPAPRLIAFYLPQFYPTPENDLWWGKGFTEWTNVVRARPLFPGHEQPHLPADLGFYDLRLPETRQAQADLAARYGIAGFCYYHYWFRGRRMLGLPLDDMLALGAPDFPFCLCWANESWTRNWDGMHRELLVAQEYSEDDDLAHIRWLINVFRDRRYITIDDRPLLLVYRVQGMPNPRHTFTIWREEARRAGLEDPYICCAETHDYIADPRENGCDAAVEFPPHNLSRLMPPMMPPQGNAIYDYTQVAAAYSGRPPTPYPHFASVAPGWDNTSRRPPGFATMLQGATPEHYEEWLRRAVARSQASSPAAPLVFVNAWNEWGESAYLEPDLQHGHAYLEATRRVLEEAGARPAPDNAPPGGPTGALPTLEARYRDLHERYDAVQREALATLGEVERERAHADELTETLVQRDKEIDRLRAAFDEQAEWAHALEAELQRAWSYAANLRTAQPEGLRQRLVTGYRALRRRHSSS